MSDWKFDGSNFSNWGVLPGVTVKAQEGPSYKNQDGNSYTKQTGDSTALQFGNKNVFQCGISNSALIGISFSSNVGATVSTTVGIPFSFQLAGSVSAFLGPKFSLNKSWELSASWAKKYTWVKDETEYELKEGSFEVTDKKAKFAKDADEWLGTKNLVAKDEVKQVLDGDMQYVKLTTNVASQDTKRVGGPHRVTAALHKFSSAAGGSITVAANVLLTGVNLKLNGAVINIG
ncbi:MAG: hypothetical protein ACKO35_11900 [Planctomycetaceae bacterium]